MSPNIFHKILPTEAAMITFAAQFALVCPFSVVVFLHGNLGAGKTTFARGFIQALGYEGRVKSPTYTIVEPYELADFTIYHFDFYRVHAVGELEYIGIQDYFAVNAVCLIEWPEKGEGLLPPADLSCYIEPHGAGREMKIVAHTARGNNIIERLQHEN